MNNLRLTSKLVTSLSIVVLLSGCGGAQSGSLPQTAPAQRRDHRASGSPGDLLYVLMTDKTYMLNYPSLTTFGVVQGGETVMLASDPNNGNVIIGDSEFAHGETKPFATVKLKNGQRAEFTAFDPTTDDIAFSVRKYSSANGFVAVYQNLNSRPKKYADKRFELYLAVGYDGMGNLFTLGLDHHNKNVFAELPKGENKFTDIPLAPSGIKAPSNILWDGTYLVLQGGRNFYRVIVSGSQLTVESKTILKGAFTPPYDKFCICEGSAIGPHLSGAPHNGSDFGLWSYPDGGPAYQVVKDLDHNRKARVYGVALSVAPPGSRTRK